MTTYAEQVRPYINFENKEEMDKHFNLFRKKHRYDLTEKENHVLFTLNGHASKFPGVCKIELEKIAKAAGTSVATAKRAFAKADVFGMIKRFKTRKDGGRRQGVTIYQFQHFELQDEPQTASDRENAEKPCESSIQELKNKAQSLILLLPSLKIFKDTNITKTYADKLPADKETIKKNALLDKLPNALRGLSVYFNKSQDIYDMVGVIFTAKNIVSKEIRIEEHEGLFRKAIASVYEYWKRQVKSGKDDYNVFGLMNKAIKELVTKIVDGSAYNVPVKETKQVTVPARSSEQVPDWMPVNKAVFTSRELIPDWMENRNEGGLPESPKKAPEIDFELERQKILAKLGY